MSDGIKFPEQVLATYYLALQERSLEYGACGSLFSALVHQVKF